MPFLAAIFAYRVLLGPFLGGHCRFHPTCSQYALDAYRLHGPVRGSWLTLRRLLRCHPLGGRGIDPVPDLGSPVADTPESCEKTPPRTGNRKK